jgi:hypothetical protein
MTSLSEFILAFLLTVVALVGVMWTGWHWRTKKRRRLHLSLVATTLGLLLWAIVVALELGEGYDLDSAGTIYPVHMAIARIATLSLAAPLVTGVITIRTGKLHRNHRNAALFSFCLVLLSAITGVWMVLAATPL